MTDYSLPLKIYLEVMFLSNVAISGLDVRCSLILTEMVKAQDIALYYTDESRMSIRARNCSIAIMNQCGVI